MKKYQRPTVSFYDMAPVSIMEGSVAVKGKIGISSFFTDEDDWTTEQTSTGNRRKYSFWDE